MIQIETDNNTYVNYTHRDKTELGHNSSTPELTHEYSQIQREIHALEVLIDHNWLICFTHKYRVLSGGILSPVDPPAIARLRTRLKAKNKRIEEIETYWKNQTSRRCV